MSRRKKRKLIGRMWRRKGKRLVRLEDIKDENDEDIKPRKMCRTSNLDQKPAENQPNKCTLSILDLPDECIVLILEQFSLEPHEICQIMKVCKKFYELSFSPRLWKIADFRFNTYLFTNRFLLLDITQDRCECLSDLERRKMFANFLIQRKALLSHLKITFDVDKEVETFLDFLNRCSLRSLKCVDIKWTIFWKYLTTARKDLQSKCFKKVLEKISECCQDVYSLKCQLVGSIDMAKAIGKFKNIQCLNVIFFGYGDQVINAGVLELILSSLTKLKELKVKVRQWLDENVKGYSLKSDSLEYFDISWSKGLRINQLDLPHLHTFLAINIFEFFQGRNSPCLFELIKNGCPELRRLNFKRSNTPGLDNFSLDEDDKREMHICECDVHAPWRVQE